jgi:hypothetical protein
LHEVNTSEGFTVAHSSRGFNSCLLGSIVSEPWPGGASCWGAHAGPKSLTLLWPGSRE